MQAAARCCGLWPQRHAEGCKVQQLIRRSRPPLVASAVAWRLCAAARHTVLATGQADDGLGGSNLGALATDMNSACNAALHAMLATDEPSVTQLHQRLDTLRLRALELQDIEADRLLRVVQALLRHTLAKEADELHGPHAAALNRMINQVAGSDWKVVLEGETAEGGTQEPRFSTWEEVLQKQRQREQAERTGGGPGDAGVAAGAMPAHTAYYELLGVSPSASPADIKAAYRQLALKLHPDVSAAPDAAQRFTEVAAAYDVLSDPASRSLYDRFGPEGMKRHAGSSAGSGNASRAWDEFKPFTKFNKRTKARDASSASTGGSGANGVSDSHTDSSTSSSSSTSASDSAQRTGAAQWAGMPQAGAIVEYPLPQVVKDELQDGRSHGVGLLVGRNCDRGDAARLPPSSLDLCEVEPLRQEEPGSCRWLPDELSCSAYVRLGELRELPVDAFDRRFDVWTLTAPLSPGCGGPELPEEVVL